MNKKPFLYKYRIKYMNWTDKIMGGYPADSYSLFEQILAVIFFGFFILKYINSKIPENFGMIEREEDNNE